MKDATTPILLIALGTVWLLDSLDWLPDVRWLWIIGLAGSGIAILLIDRITKSSVVAGPMLILAGMLSYGRQFHALGWRFIIPVMLIAYGVLMLVARSPSIPESRNLRRGIQRREHDGNGHG